MTKIVDTDGFVKAILYGDKAKLACNSSGQWGLEGRPMRIVRRLFSPLEDFRLMGITHAFNTVLDEIEKTPVQFASYENIRKPSIDYRTYIAAGNSLKAYIEKRSRGNLTSGLVQFELNRLKRRVIALEYRCEGENGGINKVPRDAIDKKQFDEICRLARRWKERDPLILQKEIQKSELSCLEEACQYPVFVENLLKIGELQNTFFKWSFRCSNPVQAFVEFPATQEKLRSCLLVSRIGCYRLLQVHGKDVEERNKHRFTEKDLKIPFQLQNKDGHVQTSLCSILNDETEMTFKGNYTLRWKEICEIFRRKNVDFGNLEVFPNGVNNWNSSKLGWWNAETRQYVVTDLKAKEGLLQLPATIVLSVEEAQKRYQKFNPKIMCDGQNFVYTLMATRRTQTLEPGGTHEYAEFAMPVDEGGEIKYHVITFSKFPTQLPEYEWEVPMAIAGTFPAIVASPDSSIYILSRQHWGHSFQLNPEEGIAVHEEIVKEMLKGHQDRLAYSMLAGENCLTCVEGIIRRVLGKERVPEDLSTVSFFDADAPGIAGKVFTLVKNMSVAIRGIVFHILFFLMGSWKAHTIVEEDGSKTQISLYKRPPWENPSFGIPAQLINKKLSGALVIN